MRAVMIHEVEGDILLTKAAAIAHGVAPNDHFDQGLALALRDQWPALVKDFRHYCHQYHPKPGTLWAWAGADGRRIIQLLTQEPSPGGDRGPGTPGKATLPNVNHALRDLEKLVREEKLQSLALPKLATGVGSLAWPEVRAQIDHHLGALSIPVYLYTTYRKGVAAKEP